MSGEKEGELNSHLNSEGENEISEKISTSHGATVSEALDTDTKPDILQSDTSSGVAESSSVSKQEEQKSENKIQIITPEVCQLQELKHLNLSNNCLVSFPTEICQLSSLEKLTLCQKNGLKELPEGLGEINTLVTLIANNNCLTKLPKRFSSLYNLQHLNLKDNKMLSLPSDMHFLLSLRDINFDGNALVRPPLEVCKGKQMITIIRYLESADERDKKILQNVLKTIASNISFENFEFFCQKLQLKNVVYKSIENNSALTVEEKVMQALDYWKIANEALPPAAMTDQLIRVLTMTGMYYLTNKVKALKLCSRVVKF